MHLIKMLVALIGGAVGGVALSFPFMMGYFLIYAGVQSLFPSLPHNPSATAMLPFLLGLYAFWSIALAFSATRAGRLKAFHLFFLVLPLPSIVIEQMWHSSSVV